MAASTYKADLDGNSSIIGGPAGAMYVYPNSPAALSVLVDTAFNIPQQGIAAPFLFNGAASPVTVTVVAPGSNSYYGCIYWDLSTQSAGVIYGPTSVTPVPTLPDLAWRTPLAFVLLTTGQATVQASNILDARSLKAFSPLSSVNNSIAATTLTVNCQNCTSVMVYVSFTGAGMTLTLSNLQVGIPVSMIAINSNAGTQTFKCSATAPSGTAYAISAKTAGGTLVGMGVTGISLVTGTATVFSGNSISGPSLYLLSN